MIDVVDEISPLFNSDEKDFCIFFSELVKRNSNLHILPDGITLTEFLESVSELAKVELGLQIGSENNQNKRSVSKAKT